MKPTLKNDPHMSYHNDGEEDYDHFQWPNEKMLWIRLGVCVVVGLVVALGLFAGAVILVNEILER